MSSYQPYSQVPPPPAAPRRLTRSRSDRMVSGVCGGFAEYFRVDANLIRIVVVAATVLGLGCPVLAYLAAWLLMPQE
ncbi:MAG TPA: PspC domain-containing protein [Nocardioides sp.]|nr:PspC domain-containing protein [Nocardioides sp.]